MRRNRKSGPPTKDEQAQIPAVPATDRGRHLLAIASLWIAILLVYSNSFGAGLIFDNAALILHDPRITDVTGQNIHQIWSTEYWVNQSGNGLYRPLTTLSYLINYSVLGNQDRPEGYHLVNYALHALNASLLYLLGLAIFGRRVAPSLALAILWAVHPVLTESVTNVVGRADLLAGFGTLAGILCYQRGLSSQGRHMWSWFLAAAMASAVGMFSKESGIVTPLIAVLFDLCFPPAAERRNRLWGYAMLALPAVLYFLVRPALSPIHIPFTDNPMVGAGFWAARLTAVKVIGKYIALLILPVSLSSDYSYNAVPVFDWSLRSWEDWQVIVALAACLGIGALAVYGWKRDRRWFFFIALAAIGLAPMANIARLIGTIMAERFLYVPAMGFAGCVLLIILAVSRRFPAGEARFLTVAVSILCLAFGARAYARNRDWFDSVSMSRSQVKAVPGSYKVHAYYYGNLDECIRNAGTALAIVDGLPDSLSTPGVYINAGKWFRDKGDKLAASAPAQSATWYRRSLEVLLRSERIAKALGENYLEIYEQLGLTYTKLKDFSNALAVLETARRQSASENVIREMSSAYIQMGDPHRAEVTLWEGLLANPENSRFAGWLVELYRHADAASCALGTAGNAPDLSCPLVRDQACTASANVARRFRNAGRPSDAARFLENGTKQFGCPAGQYQ